MVGCHDMVILYRDEFDESTMRVPAFMPTNDRYVFPEYVNFFRIIPTCWFAHINICDSDIWLAN